MAYRITTELHRINQIVSAIGALAESAIAQADPDQNAPPWAITLELLAELAKAELEVVHNSLQAEVPTQGGDHETA